MNNSCGVEKEVLLEEIMSFCKAGTVLKCSLCDYFGKVISAHVVTKHSISVLDYMNNYGPVVCDETVNRYSNQNKFNGDWIKRKYEEGYDLTEYFKNSGISQSKSIMSNPKERKRRSDLRSKTNRTKHMRDVASTAAKKTSQRKDIQENRAKVLKNWRDNNPNEFKEKCWMPLVLCKKKCVNKSKTETVLFDLLDDGTFVKNYVIFDENIFYMNRSGTKEVDLFSKHNNVIIEFDGPIHFKPIFGEDRLIQSKKVDRALEEYCIRFGIILIRIDYTKYKWRRGENSHFSDGVVETIKEIIKTQVVGNYFIGENYV